MNKDHLKNIKMLALIGCSAVSMSGGAMAKAENSSRIPQNGVVALMLEEAKSAPDCYQLLTNFQSDGVEWKNALSYSKDFSKDTFDKGQYDRGGFDRGYDRERHDKTNFDKSTMVALNIQNHNPTEADKKLAEMVDGRIKVFKHNFNS